MKNKECKLSLVEDEKKRKINKNEENYEKKCLIHHLDLGNSLLPHRSRQIWSYCGEEVIEIHYTVYKSIDDAKHS